MGFSFKTAVLLLACIFPLTILLLFNPYTEYFDKHMHIMSIKPTSDLFTYSDASQGIFATSNKDLSDKNVDYTKTFGLLVPWFELRKLLDSDKQLKLFILERHGQGFHNLAIEKYGQKEWDDYWSLKSGDGVLVWGPDPELTEKGINQARNNWKVWKDILDGSSQKWDASGPELGPGLEPEVHFASPFTRALDTYMYTWEPHPSSDPNKTAPLPIIKEGLRETIGVHTCDKRSTKSHIHHRYPKYKFETDFSEEDLLWTAEHRETSDEQNLRTKRFLDYVYNEADLQKTKIIGITAHSGVINSVLNVIGHQGYNVETGGIIAVVIRANNSAVSD